ncbi:hypothetical protein TNCV_3570131 [Trichonephila clavipes]|nr:hypothetical protein TNCV_3570131 [Trichonephila clavipes]
MINNGKTLLRAKTKKGKRIRRIKGKSVPEPKRARDLELEVNEDDIEELIMVHEDELTIEELQEILNERTPRNTMKCISF